MRKAANLWTPGWLTHLLLLGCGAALILHGNAEQGTTFIVGASIIGVIRQLERARTRNT